MVQCETPPMFFSNPFGPHCNGSNELPPPFPARLRNHDGHGEGRLRILRLPGRHVEHPDHQGERPRLFIMISMWVPRRQNIVSKLKHWKVAHMTKFQILSKIVYLFILKHFLASWHNLHYAQLAKILNLG